MCYIKQGKRIFQTAKAMLKAIYLIKDYTTLFSPSSDISIFEMSKFL